MSVNQSQGVISDVIDRAIALSMQVRCEDCRRILPADQLSDPAEVGEPRCAPCLVEHERDQAERAEQAADEAYYGGDGPPGCYGPDDRGGQ